MEDDKLTYHKFDFLKELGIEKENLGAYHSNKWESNGKWTTTLNPNTNEPIAKIRQANEKDYENCIDSMNRGKKAWMSMPAP
jgi:acyl-CoA reductase-like NAD-dependent aldehyde dehydrogenase